MTNDISPFKPNCHKAYNTQLSHEKFFFLPQTQQNLTTDKILFNGFYGRHTITYLFRNLRSLYNIYFPCQLPSSIS
jgi:hypothetical protein